MNIIDEPLHDEDGNIIACQVEILTKRGVVKGILMGINELAEVKGKSAPGLLLINYLKKIKGEKYLKTIKPVRKLAEKLYETEDEAMMAFCPDAKVKDRY